MQPLPFYFVNIYCDAHDDDDDDDNCSSFYGLDPVACSDSKLTSETINPLRDFNGTSWVGLGSSQGL
jgi:hypothetical protein